MIDQNEGKETVMSIKYKIFIVIQIVLSAVSCILTFAAARLEPALAPSAFFRLGGIILGTALFLAMQPLLGNVESNKKARIVLTAGYILLAAVSLETLSEKPDLPALCILIASVFGVALYSEAEKDRAQKRKDTLPAVISEYLIMFLTLLCSICGNIALLCSPDTAFSGKICACFGVLLLLAASVCLLKCKNCYAGKLHVLAFLISGILLHKPYMYFVILLFPAELLLVLHSKIGIFEPPETP